jgi:hypothetical protein
MGWFYKCMQAPTVPRFAMVKPKYADGSTGDLTKCVLDFLKMKGSYCGRTNTTGTYSAKLGRFINSGATRGQSDLNAIVDGRSWQIELKIGRDALSSHQVKVQEQVQAAGGLYLVVKSFTDFIHQYKKHTGISDADLFTIKKNVKTF